MKTLIINLKRRPDRKEEMRRQLARAGLTDIEFVEAIDGREIDREGVERYDEAIATRFNGERMLSGEVACALSHIGVYERMLRDNLERILILEDDVVLPTSFAGLLERIAMETKKFDLVTFNYPPVQILHAPNWNAFRRKPYLFLYFLLKIPYAFSLKCYEMLLGLWYARAPRAVWLPRPLYLAGAYLLSSKGARKLLSHTDPVHYTADKLLNKARVLGKERLSMRACVPLLIRQNQRDFGSDMAYETKYL